MNSLPTTQSGLSQWQNSALNQYANYQNQVTDKVSYYRENPADLAVDVLNAVKRPLTTVGMTQAAQKLGGIDPIASSIISYTAVNAGFDASSSKSSILEKTTEVGSKAIKNLFSIAGSNYVGLGVETLTNSLTNNSILGSILGLGASFPAYPAAEYVYDKVMDFATDETIQDGLDAIFDEIR